MQDILNKAQKEIGFETGDSKLLVEAIMSSEQECTFTITKLDEQKITLENINSSFILNLTLLMILYLCALF